MPKIFGWRGFRFHFYSNEGDPREPVHVHVTKGRDTAKFWLLPDVVPVYNRGFDAHVLRQLEEVVVARREEIEEAWHEFFT